MVNGETYNKDPQVPLAARLAIPIVHPKYESAEEKAEKFHNFLMLASTRLLEIGKFDYLYLSNGEPVWRLDDIPLDEDLLFVSHLPNFVVIKPR